MSVRAINIGYDFKTKNTNIKNDNKTQIPGGTSISLTDLRYMPSFGYCDIHMGEMRTLNSSFERAINSVFAQRDSFWQMQSQNNIRYDKNNEMNITAAQMLAQYANYQYSMAEVIPSYAMESAPSLIKALEKTKVFSTPLNILMNIHNVQDLKAKEGIDKNSGRPYTDEQMRKSKANTKLYSTVLLLEMLDKNIDSISDNEEKRRVLELRSSVLSSISEIYGEDAYNRIQVLKKMGANASDEDKRKSLNLVKEFDEKAKDLKFKDEFEEKLDDLINYVNRRDNRTEILVSSQRKIPPVTLKYHTHPHDHDHSHEHEQENGHHHNEQLTHEEMHKLGIQHNH